MKNKIISQPRVPGVMKTVSLYFPTPDPRGLRWWDTAVVSVADPDGLIQFAEQKGASRDAAEALRLGVALALESGSSVFFLAGLWPQWAPTLTMSVA